MKRSKWCKYCTPSKKHINLGLCERIISNCPCGVPVNNAEYILQQYRDSFAKEIRAQKTNIRAINKLQNGALGKKFKGPVLRTLINCARMLDPEKSARVAATVQEIKEWRRQLLCG